MFTLTLDVNGNEHQFTINNNKVDFSSPQGKLTQEQEQLKAKVENLVRKRLEKFRISGSAKKQKILEEEGLTKATLISFKKFTEEKSLLKIFFIRSLVFGYLDAKTRATMRCLAKITNQPLDIDKVDLRSVPKINLVKELTFYKTVKELHLLGNMPTAVWDVIQKSHGAITKITLEGAFGDEELKYFSSLQHLENVDLSDSAVEGNGLIQLAKHNLRYLSLKHTKVTDASLQHLKYTPHLLSLDLSYNQITGSGLNNLQYTPHLESLVIQSSSITTDLSGLRYVSNLRKLLLDKFCFTSMDRGFTHLAQLHRLEVLELPGTEITAMDLPHIAQLITLKELSCKGATDEALAYLKELTKLEVLSLLDAKITDLGLKEISHLSHLSPLESLRIRGNLITDIGMPYIGLLLNLRILHLQATKITDAGLAYLASLSKLEELNLDANTALTNAGMVHLASLSNLRSLCLAKIALTTGLKNLQQLPNLRCLSFRTNESGVDEISMPDSALKYIADMNLRMLDLSFTRVSDKGLKNLSQMSSLQNLNLETSSVTDIGLLYLTLLPNLYNINVKNTKVTREGKLYLKSHLPNLTITDSILSPLMYNPYRYVFR